MLPAIAPPAGPVRSPWRGGNKLSVKRSLCNILNTSVAETGRRCIIYHKYIMGCYGDGCVLAQTDDGMLIRKRTAGSCDLQAGCRSIARSGSDKAVFAPTATPVIAFFAVVIKVIALRRARRLKLTDIN